MRPTESARARLSDFAGLVERGFDLSLFEEVSPFEVGDASLGDEAADMAVVDAEAFGDGWQVEQRGAAVVR